MALPEEVWILGVRVHRLRAAEVPEHLQRLATGGNSLQVVTVNPEFVVAARRNAAFRRVLNGAALSLADGFGIVWASRVLGCPLPERVTGVDTMQRLCAWAAQKGWPVFLLGARPGVAERAAAVLARSCPGLQVAGCYAGSPDPVEEDGIVARVQRSGARLLFVAYGAPQQDLWIARNLPRLGVSVAMGVGGAFDFVAGVVPRAPVWMQERGLEWLYRLVRQPWRWRRMLALPWFAVLVLWERARRRGGKAAAGGGRGGTDGR
ncbi:MAG: WecB/TagA/CpsF family glycosyltransferase [Anaerolineae bacterium]|nr:WecB/TagA/CpsF family glycosyltransferase [Anaerolineae bacterium]